MKKSIFLAGFTVAVMAASAQSVQKDEPPKPPPPPPPPVAKLKDVPPPPPPPSVPPPPDAPPPSIGETQTPDDFNAFLKKNPSIKSIQWRNDEMIIGLKSGKEERYNMADAASVKAVETKYGTLPQAPPPPPPPPPVPPAAPKPPKKITLS